MEPGTKLALRIVGIVLICVGIHFLAQILGLVILGCGMGFLFLP